MSAPAPASKPRPANAFIPKKTAGAKRTAPAEVTETKEESKEVNAQSGKKPKVAGKDRFSDKRIELLDLEKNDLYKQIKFIKPDGSKMIYFALPNEKGGYDKAFNIVAKDRITRSGLKVLPPKGTIITYNTIFSYDATPEENKFWSEKFLPHLCEEIWKNAPFFYGKLKGERIMKKDLKDALDDIYESMTGDSGEMFFTGAKPNKDPSKEDYAPSLKIKVKEDPKTQLPVLDIFDKTTAKQGKPEDNYEIYSHPELLKFQAEHKEHGATNVSKHNAAVAKLQAVWKTRDQVAKEVGFQSINDAMWQFLGLSPVNGKLWFSTNLKVINRKKLNDYKGSSIRQPGDRAINPFDDPAPAATTTTATPNSVPVIPSASTESNVQIDSEEQEQEDEQNEEYGEEENSNEDGEEVDEEASAE